MREAWEHESSGKESYMGRRRHRGQGSTILYEKEYQTVMDSDRLATRKGDIVKFGSGFFERPFGDWREWFLTSRKDRERFWTRDTRIPIYAINQYAVVANRYRWVKYKYRTYTDYGVIFMMITGDNPCHIRRYYVERPYQMISAFPHKKLRSGNIHVRMKKPFQIVGNTWFLFEFNLSMFIEKLLQKYGEGETSRDMFLKKIKQVWEIKR